MKIKTEVLKEMVSKVIKALSNNKLMPITSLIAIKSEQNGFSLITTDGNNVLQVSTFIENVGDMYTVVDADVFSKLIGKTNCEEIELNLKESCLEIVGNGKYQLEIVLDSEGNIIEFPRVERLNNGVSVDINKLKQDIVSAKVAIADTMEVPVLTGYYIGDKVITTNREKVCYIDEKLLNTPILISNSTAELLQLFGNEVQIGVEGDKLCFISSSIELSCNQLPNKELYPVDAIDNLLKNEYEHSFEISKEKLLNALDRMSIFTSQYDSNGVNFKVSTDNFLTITSKKSNAAESISILGVKLPEYQCIVDVEMLKSVIEKVLVDNVTIYYGSQKSLKVVDGNTTMIVSLLSE